MLKQILHITYGYFVWLKYKLRFRMNEHKVLLVLTGDNKKIDYYALLHLGDYVKRKIADMALILVMDKEMLKLAKSMDFPFTAEVLQVKEKEILSFYDYFCFEEYMDNVVFTYTGRPKENLLWKLLEKTDIHEEEAVCLGYYCLRHVPVSSIRMS